MRKKAIGKRVTMSLVRAQTMPVLQRPSAPSTAIGAIPKMTATSPLKRTA